MPTSTEGGGVHTNRGNRAAASAPAFRPLHKTQESATLIHDDELDSFKLRKQVKAAATRDERNALAQPMLNLVATLLDLVEQCTKKDFIGYADAQKIITAMERLYKQLYFKYKELREGEKRMNKKFIWPTDKIIMDNTLELARNFLAAGAAPDMVVKATGLSLRKVKSLMKQPVEKKPA
jgi:hypothetical protein